MSVDIQRAALGGATVTMKDMVQPIDPREKVVSEIGSEVAGIGTGALAGTAIVGGLAKFSDKFKNFAFKDASKGVAGGIKFQGKAAGVAIIGGLGLIGSAIMNSMAKNANQKYRDTKGQLNQATTIIANQQQELSALRNEAPGAREHFAAIGSQNQGSFVDRVQASRANSSELGL